MRSIDNRRQHMEKETNSKPKKRGLKIVLAVCAVVLAAIIGVGAWVMISAKNEMADIEAQNTAATLDYSEPIEYKTEWTYDELLNHLVDESKLSKGTEVTLLVNDQEADPSTALSFDTVGSYKVKVALHKEYSYRIIGTVKEIDVTKEVTLNVEDTIVPVIRGARNKRITVGDKLDLLSGISAMDEVEGELTLQSEGDVDVNRAGTYPVKVYAVDANGNKAEAEFSVIVKEKPVEPEKPEESKPASSTSSGSASNNAASSGSSNNNSNNASSNNTSSNNASSNNASSNGSSSGNSSSNESSQSSSSGTLTAAEKDKQARAVAKQIADTVMSRGYSSDIDKVGAAAEIVSSYYYKGVHKESGEDYRTPYGVFVKGESSCAGATRALGLVLDYMGYSWKHANENQWTHQWVIVTMDGQVGYADGQVGWVGYGTHPAAEQ